MPKELFPLDTPYPVDINRTLIEGLQRNLSSVVALFDSLQGVTGSIINRIETIESRIGVAPVSKPKSKPQPKAAGGFKVIHLNQVRGKDKAAQN